MSKLNQHFVDILKTMFQCVSYDQSGSLDNYREKVLKLHNDYRNQKGLPEYELNERVGQQLSMS